MTFRLGLALALALTTAAHSATTVKGVVPNGYVVQALTHNGTILRATAAAGGKFTIAFGTQSAKGASLQLLTDAGSYFGPVVLKRSAGRAYTNLSGKSVNVKKLAVLDGFAAPKKVPGKAIDRTVWSAADDGGRPLGAGKLGLVSSTALRTRRSTTKRDSVADPSDRDGDGIPDPFDADDDGDLTLDSVDADTAATATVHTGLFLHMTDALNLNAAGVTQEQIDAVIAGDNRFSMIFWFFRFEPPRFTSSDISGAHVDCFGLPYCRPGDGTATISGVSESSPALPKGAPWASYTPDGSTYPNLEKLVRQNDPQHPAWEMSIQPHATPAELRPGDSYNVVFSTADGEVTIPASLSAYFVTVPAIASYDAGAGPVAVSYPVSPGSPGTSQGNPIVMSSSSIRFTFWRPQRPAIAGAESGGYTDMGHLHYGIPLYIPGHGEQFGCPAHYSDLSSTLTLGYTSEDTKAVELFPLTDGSDDASPDPSRTLSFTLDLGACLSAHGITPEGLTVDLSLTATGEPSQGGVDAASQTITVQFPPP